MKNFKYLLLSIIFMFISFSFVACDKSSTFEFEIRDEHSIQDQLDEKIDYFYDNIYESNLLTSGMTYNLGELSLMFNDFDAYIELGEIKHGNFNSITFDNRSYSQNQDVTIYINNNCKIKDKALYIEDNKIYVNAFILYTENKMFEEFYINSHKYSIERTNNTTLLSYVLTFKPNSNNTINLSNNTYSVQIKDNEPLIIQYLSRISDRMAIIKKINNNYSYILSRSITDESINSIYQEVQTSNFQNGDQVELKIAIRNFLPLNINLNISK